MSAPAIDRFKEQLGASINCIEYCIRNKFILQALIQIYSLIDAMSWIYRPDNKEDGNRDDFINWVNTFMLIDSNLECNAWDLYAARCAILHSMTPRAKLIREGKAKCICYAWGNRTTTDIKEIIRNKEIIGKVEKGVYVAVHIDELYTNLRSGIDNFSRFINDGKINFSKFYQRIDNYFELISF